MLLQNVEDDWGYRRVGTVVKCNGDKPFVSAAMAYHRIMMKLATREEGEDNRNG